MTRLSLSQQNNEKDTSPAPTAFSPAAGRSRGGPLIHHIGSAVHRPPPPRLAVLPSQRLCADSAQQCAGPHIVSLPSQGRRGRVSPGIQDVSLYGETLESRLLLRSVHNGTTVATAWGVPGMVNASGEATQGRRPRRPEGAEQQTLHGPGHRPGLPRADARQGDRRNFGAILLVGQVTTDRSVEFPRGGARVRGHREHLLNEQKEKLQAVFAHQPGTGHGLCCPPRC
jgi:hypothetical protein